jgi:hypothetical protein
MLEVQLNGLWTVDCRLLAIFLNLRLKHQHFFLIEVQVHPIA